MKLRTRVIALLLSLLMVFSYMPELAYATAGESADTDGQDKNNEFLLEDEETEPETEARQDESEEDEAIEEDAEAADFEEESETDELEYVSGSAPMMATSASGLTYETVSGGIKITGYTGSDNILEIPAEIDGSPVIEIDKRAFANSDISQLILPDGIKTLSASIINGNTAIREIEIPASVTTMNGYDSGDKGAFYGSAIEKVTVKEGMTTLPPRAFQGCASLTEVNLPDTITSIREHAFLDCTSLQHIDLPKDLESIGVRAFVGTDLQSLVLPDGIKTLSASIINGNTVIKEIEVPASVTTMNGYDAGDKGAFYGSAIEKITVKEGMTTLPPRAFQGCTSLTEVNLPDTITSISEYAFLDCTSLQNIDLPKDLTSIGLRAFVGTDLQSLVLPDGIKTLSASIINGNTVIKEIELPASLTKMNGYDSGDKGAFYGSAIEKVTVKDGMSTLPPRAFNGCTSLTEVILPEGLTSLGNNVFEGCTGLETIQLPESLTSIGEYAFRDCSSLQHIDLPKDLESIGVRAFVGTDLQSLVLPDGIKTLSASIINGNTVIKEIEVPASVTTMNGYDAGDKGAFYGSAIEKVTVKEGMTTLPHRAFNGCTSLTEVNLPESLTSLGNNVFEGCSSIQHIELPQSVTSIGDYAFRNCTRLESIDLSGNIKKLGTNLFQNDGDVKVFCDFKTLSVKTLIAEAVEVYDSGKEFIDTDDHVLDVDGSSFAMTTSSSKINGSIPFTVKYKIKDSWAGKVSGMTLNLFVPWNSELVESTIMLNGQVITNYTYNRSKHTLSIPVTENEGTVAFGVTLAESKTIYSYASLSMRKNGAAYEEMIGALGENFAGITISCDSQTSKTTINVSGVAPKSTEVSIYVNDEKAKSVTSKKTGSWNADIELPDPGTFRIYQVRAAVTIDGNEASASRQVTYSTATPEVTSFEMEYKEHQYTKHVDIMNSKDVKPVVYFLPGSEFIFKVGIENPERVDAVYVNSTRNNITKQLKAEYDEESGLYVTKGYFDPKDKNYVPGNLTVTYDQKSGTMTEEQMQTTVVDKLVNDATAAGATVSNVTVTKEDDGSELIEGTVDMSKVLGDVAYDNMKTSFQTFDSETGYHVSEIFEMYGIAKDALKVIHTFDGDEMTVGYDFSDPKDIIMVMSKGAGYADKISSTVYALKLSDISWQSYESFRTTYTHMQNWSNGMTAVSYALDVAAIYADHDSLVDQINSSSSITNKSKALREADELFHDQFMFLTMTTAMGLMIAATGVGASVALPAVALLGTIKILSDVFWQGRTNHALTGEFRLNMVVDPSGYIYDMQSLERVPDATVTAYWIPDDGSDGFWDKKPADTEYGTMWDASEYEQANPLQTNADGKYAWDVPQGWWRVKTEKEGYETTWSDWVPVPPIQTDVNIGILSNVVPEPTEATAYVKNGSFTYNGRAAAPQVVVFNKITSEPLKEGTDYKLTYNTNRINAGVHSIVVTYLGKYADNKQQVLSFSIAKAANTLAVKAKKPSIKYKKLKKKNQTITAKKAYTVSNAQGTVTYKLVSVSKSKFKKYFKVNAKSGKITVKKKLKKGTYKVKVKVTSAGNANYNAAAKTVAVKVKVK